jgi:hypothetical protein
MLVGLKKPIRYVNKLELIMPTSLHGIGTRFYGKRDFQPDASYITTEFVRFIGIPIVPRKSLRVRHVGSSGIIFPIIHSEENYMVLATTRPNRKQVLSVYAFVAFMVFWVLGVFWVYGRMEGKLGQTAASLLWYLFCAVPALFVIALRSAAKRKIKSQQDAAPNAGPPGTPPASVS